MPFRSNTGARSWRRSTFERLLKVQVKTGRFWQFGDNPTQGYLRYSETRNNQQQKIRWAKDYEFEKHVDDLREESGAKGARTPDLLSATQALFQTEL